MKAAQFHEYGGPEVLRVEDIAVPVPAKGEVLIKVAATSFNPIDAGLRAGMLKEVVKLDLPGTPGLDVSGTISQVGEGVTDFVVGDAVIGYLPRTAPGAAAEYVVAAADILANAPGSIPLEEAAVLPLVGLTAWQAVIEHAKIQPGERVLVNGAGGAAGGYAVQLAVNAGADVLATVSPASRERVESYGPATVIDHTYVSLADAVQPPVDVVVNFAPTPFAELLAVTRPGGRIVSAASLVDASNDRDVSALRMASRSDASQLAQLVEAVDAGSVRVWVADRRPLEDVAAVHEARVGKTILIPN